MGVFFNPYFILRSRLFQKIMLNKSYITGRVLDFGCGSAPYKSYFDYVEYVGLDMHHTGHSHLDSNVDIFYDGKIIPLPDGSFDTVFSSEVFEHVFNMSEILSEINRVTKNGGILVATTPFIWEEHEKPYDYARYTSFALIDLLRKANFEVIKIDRTSSSIETLIQLFLAYLYALMFRLKLGFFIRVILILLLFSPLNIFSFLLRKMNTKNPILYLNHVVIARKIL